MAKKTKSPKIGVEKIESAFMRLVKPDKNLKKLIEDVSLRNSVRIDYLKTKWVTVRGMQMPLIPLIVIALTLIVIALTITSIYWFEAI